ncbi:MAG: lactate utilization protein C [Hyphomicrobiales bacterium]
MSARDAILARIRQRMPKGDGETRRTAVAARLSNPKRNLIPARGEGNLAHRINVFTRYMETVGGTVDIVEDANAVPEAVARHLRENNLPAAIRRGTDPLLANLPWHRAPMIEVTEGPARDKDVASLSHAFAAAAESGTVILTSGPENPTTLNFLPEMHIVVLEAQHLYGNYEEAWTRLREAYGPGRMPRAVNMISGPSRTADIEQTIVRPAHGPKNMHVIIVR